MAVEIKLLYRFETSHGTFYIAQHRNGRFYAMLDEQLLDGYERPSQAAEDLAQGVSELGDSTRGLGIPSEISGWEKMPS